VNACFSDAETDFFRDQFVCRENPVVQWWRALAAVGQALSVLEATRQPYLVMRADGAAAGLKEAHGVYRNVCYRARLQSHSARYAFAQSRVQAYCTEGYSEREARAATSLDLGHGDGRGRYVASVYVRQN